MNKSPSILATIQGDSYRYTIDCPDRDGRDSGWRITCILLHDRIEKIKWHEAGRENHERDTIYLCNLDPIPEIQVSHDKITTFRFFGKDKSEIFSVPLWNRYWFFDSGKNIRTKFVEALLKQLRIIHKFKALPNRHEA